MWRRGDEPVVGGKPEPCAAAGTAEIKHGWTPQRPSDVEPPPYLLSLRSCLVIKFIYSRPASVMEQEEHLLIGIAAFSLPFPPRLSFVIPPLSPPATHLWGDWDQRWLESCKVR